MNDGKKTKTQKHKNKTAFKITFDSQALDLQSKVSLANLCIRCTQVMEWKLQYNKYIKMTQPARCNICRNKTVLRTYMTACQPCVQQKNICAKCLTPDYEAPQEVKTSEKDKKQQQKKQYQNQIQFMKTLQQRSRRTVRRNLQKGKITWSQQQEYFIDEEGNKMIGLHFRKGFRNDEEGNQIDDDDIDGDDMFGDDDDDMQENEDSQTVEKQKNNQKKKKKQEANKEQRNEQKRQQKQGNEEDKSDVQGDEVDCENELDLDGQDQDDDFQDQQQEEQQEIKDNKKKNKGEKENK